VPPERGRGGEGGREGEALVRAALEHKALTRLSSDPNGTSRSPKETYYRVKTDLLGTSMSPGEASLERGAERGADAGEPVDARG
jgi:hypothetical protein